MSLLKEIQYDAASSTVQVSVVLRKCKILAAHLQNENFTQWVNLELNGYGEQAALPLYRVFSNPEIRGDFHGAFGSGYRDVPIPSIALPEKFREYADQPITLRSSCSFYDDLINQSNVNNSQGYYLIYWPANMIALLANYELAICPDCQCIQIWTPITRGIFVKLLESVRDKALGFALDIERENPKAGEVMGSEPPIEQKKVQQIFNQNFHGSIGNVSSGGQNFSQQAAVKSRPNQQNFRSKLSNILNIWGKRY